MLTIKGCSETVPFRRLENPFFWRQYFWKHLSNEAHPFFKNFKIAWRFEKPQWKFDKKFLVSEIIAFELVAGNAPFYDENTDSCDLQQLDVLFVSETISNLLLPEKL